MDCIRTIARSLKRWRALPVMTSTFCRPTRRAVKISFQPSMTRRRVLSCSCRTSTATSKNCPTLPLQRIAKGALLIVAVSEVVSLGAIKSPGEMGADIVVGEGQSIGNGLIFGGPYVGLFAVRQKHVRQMPGRLAGETVDADGRRGYVLTLSTREQHIRREKATSNICTNSGLCALAFTIHMTLLGESGLRRLAAVNHANAVALADALAGVKGVKVLNETFFNEFTIRVPGDGAAVIDRLADQGVLGGVPVSRLEPDNDGVHDLIVVAATEMTSSEDRASYVAALTEALA